MPSHTRKTIETYDAVAPRYLENQRNHSFEPDWLRSFVEGVPRGAIVLDLGSGPGRDAAALRSMGLAPICVDRSIGMLRAGEDEYPNPRILGDMLRLPLKDRSISGVWANASLLHFSPADFDLALAEISRVLVTDGTLYLSLKEGSGAEWERERYGKERWFQYWEPAELDRVVESAGFRISNSGMERTTHQAWLMRQCVLGT